MTRFIVILIAVLAITVVIVPVGSAEAEICNFNVSTGNWTLGTNWSCGHEPTFADLAVILSGNTCTMDDPTGEADSLTVESTATLNVQTGNTLSLDSSDTNSTITGTVNLQGSGSELAFKDNNQTIDGTGKIVGQNNAAKITVTSGETLTNDATIEGKLRITGLGDFLNHGTVHANTSGILELSTDEFDDDSTAEWKVTGSATAKLYFNLTSGTIALLDGDFTLQDKGTIEVDSAGFQTGGSLLWKGGTIDVRDGCLADFGA